MNEAQKLKELRSKAGAFRMTKVKNNGIGREGFDAFSGTITENGIAIGTFASWGDGGADEVRVSDPAALGRLKAQEALGYAAGELPYNSGEWLCNTLVELHDYERQIKRWQKDRVLFTLSTDTEGGFRTVKTADYAKAGEYLAKKYGAGKFEILAPIS